MLAWRGVRIVDVAFTPQQGWRVVAARANRPATANPFQRCRRLAQMIELQVRLLGYAMLPHMIGKFMAARDGGLEGTRIELANAPHGEDRRLDVMLIEELDQPPDAHASPELALCQLHRRFVVEAPQEHGIEIGREVDGDARPIRPDQLLDFLVTAAVPLSCGL